MQVIPVPATQVAANVVSNTVAQLEKEGATRALGVVLSADGITDDDIEDILGPYAVFAKFSDFDAITKIAEHIESQRPEEALKILNTLSIDQLQSLVKIIYEVITPLQVKEADYDPSIAQIGSLQDANTPYTTIATSSIAEETPDELIKVAEAMKASLKAQKARNILVLTDPRINTEALKTEYLTKLNDIISEYTDSKYSLFDIYDRSKILTLEEFEKASNTDTLTKDNACNAAVTAARKIIGKDYGKLVYLGKKDYFAQAIDLAALLKGVLNNNAYAIRKALKLLGRKDNKIDFDKLGSTTVLDFTTYTRKLQNHRRAVREVKSAL